MGLSRPLNGRETAMIEQMMSSDWTSLAHLPSYGLTVVGIPVLALVAIKILFVAKEGKGKAKKEWVFSEERDADGLPVLTSARGKSARGRHAQ